MIPTMSHNLVLLADVVQSRTIADRERFQRQLKHTFDEVNEAENEWLSVPLTTMKGVDEFGCVLTHRAPLPDIIVPLQRVAHPTGIRFGLAAGSIDVGTGSDTVAEMDGPAFHEASSLLEELRDTGQYVAIETDDPLDDLIAGALDLLAMGELSVTPRQLEIITAYGDHGTQSAAGDELGIHQQAVSESLTRSQYRQRQAVRTQLRETLEELYDSSRIE